MLDKTLPEMIARFQNFAAECAKQDSPFYERLSKYVATNEELLAIAAHASREPIPNVFLGAVHYLLLKGSDHALGEYYSSLTAKPRTDGDLLACFHDFCLARGGELATLAASRLVQTNEVNRCAVLAPAFSLVYDLGGRRPMTCVEVGASAGLNLLWNRYHIDYSDGTVLGDANSSVRIRCDQRGDPFPFGSERPEVAGQVGIDLNPIDLGDVDQRLWLRALVWPDHRQRADRLEKAVEMALRNPPRLVRGDALAELPAILDRVPHDWTLCVFNSAVLYQFSADEKERLSAHLENASIESPVWQVSAETESGLKLLVYRDGRLVEERFLAKFDAHGRWLRWEG